MIKAIITDDETRSRQTTAELIRRYCPGLELCGEAASGEEAYQLVCDTRPQLVFLDIEMPYEDGFDFLRRFDRIPFEVIFLTAHQQYAIQAIRICALDYLLKPLNISDLKAAVEKATGRIAAQQSQAQFELLLHNMSKTRAAEHHKLAIPAREGLEFIDMKDILVLEADGSYTNIRLHAGKRILSTRHLKEYEDMLPTHLFFRAHHSFIINLNQVRSYHKGEGGYVTLADGSCVDISKRRKKEFLDLFGT